MVHTSHNGLINQELQTLLQQKRELGGNIELSSSGPEGKFLVSSQNEFRSKMEIEKVK